MAATITGSPATPASCYRPLQFKVQRTDPSGTIIVDVFIADSTDVSTLGNGLAVGDVVVYYTAAVSGSIPVAVGQTIIMDADCGPYKGVHMVLNAFTDGSDKYAVIDALDLGAFTPDAFTGAFKVWLNNYTVHLKLLVYTDPAAAPQVVLLEAKPDERPGTVGLTTFNVDTYIRDYFSHRIDAFVVPASGSSIVQNAHGVTALFYRVHIAEVYDIAGETQLQDPFDGTHDILVDSTASIATMRVAVNAIHPYTGTIINQGTADFSDFIVGDTDLSRKVMNQLPAAQVVTQAGTVAGRKVTLGPSDRFGFHMLTDPAEGHLVDYRLRIYDLTGTPSLHGDVDFDLSTTVTSAFRVGIGPADLGSEVDGMTKYSVWIRSSDSNYLSEPIEVTIDPKCREGSRTFGWLNKLGGVDHCTFRGREISTSEAKRATVSKPYGAGTGYDWRERTYRSEPSRLATVSTIPIHKEVRKWLAQDLFESANVNVVVDGRACPCAIVTGELLSYNTGPLYKEVTLEYRLGVDNESQQA